MSGAGYAAEVAKENRASRLGEIRGGAEPTSIPILQGQTERISREINQAHDYISQLEHVVNRLIDPRPRPTHINTPQK